MEEELKGSVLRVTMQSLFHMICCLVTDLLCLCAKKVSFLAANALMKWHALSFAVYYLQNLVRSVTADGK